MTTKSRPQEFSVNVETKVSAKRVADLLVGALEGGSSYWIEEILLGPEANGFGSAKPEADDRYPLSGGYIDIRAVDDEPGVLYRLNLTALERGLKLLAAKYPKDLLDIVNENDDAETSDKLLQLALLGEIVYG